MLIASVPSHDPPPRKQVAGDDRVVLRAEGLDALIITGANVANPALDEEPFWQPLEEVVEWASQHVTSVLCSCLATHSLLKHFHGIDRVLLPSKRWGVYNHRVTRPGHPLLRDVNTRFDVPHSRNNDIDRAQFERAGLTVLAESAEGGVHLAVSADQFRIVVRGKRTGQPDRLLHRHHPRHRQWPDL